MLIRRKNPHAYCRAHLATQQRLWRQKASWCFLVSKCPEAGKGGKHSDWEAHLASSWREALQHEAQPDWLRSNIRCSHATADQHACARKYPHYNLIFLYFALLLF